VTACASIVCDQDFPQTHSLQKYCAPKCRSAQKNYFRDLQSREALEEILTCDLEGCEVQFKPKKKTQLYCSPKCRDLKWGRSEKNREGFYRRQEENLDKHAAYSAVLRAVKSGRLVRLETCPKCNKPGRVEAHHHKGYSKEFQLDVVWLCKKCHHEEHEEHCLCPNGIALRAEI